MPRSASGAGAHWMRKLAWPIQVTLKPAVGGVKSGLTTGTSSARSVGTGAYGGLSWPKRHFSIDIGPPWD